MSIKEGKLILAERHKTLVNRVVDEFFLSLAIDQKEQAIGIIFSGAGTDGTNGINEIHKRGGTVFVEDPASAEYRSVPLTAINLDHPNAILFPEKMGVKLQEMINH